MESMTWVAVGIGVVLIAAFAALVSLATRTDRLHNEVLRSRAALERLLHARATTALAIASTGRLDPASAVILADIASRALQDPRALVPDGLDPNWEAIPTLGAVETRDRALVESELSRVLRVLVPQVRRENADDSEMQDLVTALNSQWYRATIARSLHNTRVVQSRQLRLRWAVRTFRLAGRAPLPVTFDMDDSMPEGDA
ncbi:MAG: hypothetical protein ACQERF_04080 [Actinomycetota bacterium]